MGTINDSEVVEYDTVKVNVSSRDKKKTFVVEVALVAPEDKFNMPNSPPLTNEDGELFTHLDGLNIDEVAEKDITMLIGADLPEALLYSEVRKGNKGQPLALKTMFGWSLFGGSSGCAEVHNSAVFIREDPVQASLPSFWEREEQPPSVFCNLIHTREDLHLHNSLEKFWKQEHRGILPPKDIAMSRDDINSMEILERHTKNIGNRLEVPMLWESPSTKLPYNLPMALQRWRYLEKRLRAKQELREPFQATVKALLTADPPLARKMSADEASKIGPRSWILPLHPVINPNKPGKVRVCNDAAAEYEGVSLNKVLLTGPDMLNSLVGSLLRFRNGPVAIAGDIEAMFHQVRGTQEDADSLRFLWKEDVFIDGPPDVYQMLVHIFGAKCSPACCSYALKRTGRDAAPQYDAMTYECAVKSFYMDDLTKSVGTEGTAIQLAQELISMFKRAVQRKAAARSTRSW